MRMNMTMTTKSTTDQDQTVWYRLPIMWLVVALPLIAVVASFITLFIAIANPDPVIKAAADAAEERPAVEGRNHAATGGLKKEPVAPNR